MSSRRVLAFAVLLGGGLVPVLGPGVAGASAEGSVVRDAVVSTLDPTGKVEATRVSQLIQLESTGGREATLRVPRVADLESYRNLSGFSSPSGEDGAFVWRTNGRLDTTTLARSSKKLPLDVGISYTVNGRPTDPSNITGKSGTVGITVDLENVSGDPRTLRSKGVTSPYLTGTVNQYIPFEYLVRVDFPTDRWRAVGGDGVHVQPGGVDVQIASASGVMSPPATPTTATIEMEATTDDALLPHIQVFANALASEQVLEILQKQYEGLKQLYSGFGTLGDTLTTIYDGTNALVDGVDELLSGVGQRSQTTGDPIVTLDVNGDPTTLMAAIGVIGDGISGKILPQIGERNESTGEGKVVKDAKGHATTLIGGLQDQKNAYDDDLIPGAKKGIKGINSFIDQVEDGGAALNSGAKELTSGAGELSSGGDELGSGADELVAGTGPLGDGVDAFVAGAAQLGPGFDQLEAGIDQLGGGLTTLISKLQSDNPQTPDFYDGLKLLFDGLGTVDGNGDPVIVFVDGNGDPCQGPAPGCTTPGTVIAALGVMQGGIGQLLDGLGSVDGNGDPVIVYVDGNGDPCQPGPPDCQPATVIAALGALRAGMQTIEATLTTLQGGVSSIASGLSGDFKTGLLSLKTTAQQADTLFGALDVSGTLSAMLQGIASGVDGLVGNLDNTIVPTLQALAAGIGQVNAGVGTGEAGVTALLDKLATTSPTDQTFLNGLTQIDDGLGTLIGQLGTQFSGGLAALRTGLGDKTAPQYTDDGTSGGQACDPAPGADSPCLPVDVMSALLLLAGGADELSTGAGALGAGVDQLSAGATQLGEGFTAFAGGADQFASGADQFASGAGDFASGATLFAAGGRKLVPSVVSGLREIKGAFTNPEWNREQKALEDRTPKEYFQDCPACFDPASDAFDPSTDRKEFQPGLLEVFQLFSEGIEDSLPKLQSFDDNDPGLVEGLQQVADGLDEVAKNLQTFDPDNPGLVDGLKLAKSGLQQVSQGLFATNELGVRTTRGQIGDQGDDLGRQQAAITEAAKSAAHTGPLGEQADSVATTYVFDLAAQSTGTRDNAVRAGLLALSGTGLAVLWRRPRLFG